MQDKIDYRQLNISVFEDTAERCRTSARLRESIALSRQAQKFTGDALRQLHIKRLRRILDIAVTNKVENIVLGAFGCGAFMNDPKVVASATAEVIRDYHLAFRAIEFAIFCRPGFERNYREFCKALL